MKPVIAVIDYEMGNLHSVSKAVEKAGGRVQITSSASAINRAAGIVLPGVGAFGEAVRRLKSMKLVSPILKAVEQNKPFLGICLGLQLLFDRSEESPGTKGLGVFAGRVVRFKMKNASPLKVPHMGWNTLEAGPASKVPAMKGVRPETYFYFVHSYYPVPDKESLIATRTSYGKQFCSSIGQGRLFASQFHPEKSGKAGSRILSNFVQQVNLCA